MEEKLCPECGANVEGLIKWCDLCGADLNPVKSMFYYRIYSTGSFYDIGIYINRVFDELDKISPEPYREVLERIEVDFWCFPIRKKTGVAYYGSRKKAIVTIEIKAEDYLLKSKEEKYALIRGEMQEKMEMLRMRLEKKGIRLNELFSQIEDALRT